MDDNFFKQLDEALTNVGSDKHWERVIGGHKVWLSPVPFKRQHHINEILTNQELGANVIGEVKRLTLSYSIVGFDGFDLRQYRNDSPVFPMTDRERKPIKVPLHKYILHKMEEWGIEWIDAAFDVFADITETLKKENLKEVKFENARDKREELAELEEKVRDLRIELGMPPLTEEKDETAKGESAPAPEPEPEPQAQFNPFQKMTEAPGGPPAEPPSVPSPPAPVPTAAPRNVPVRPVDGATSTPDRPYISGRIAEDVIEERPDRPPAPPIVLDPVHDNRNPRFRPPSAR